jgi:hypothetical protein
MLMVPIVLTAMKSFVKLLSTLLQDPTNSLENMVVFTRANNVDGPDSPDGYEILREVTSGLANNTKLIGMRLNWLREEMTAIGYNYFQKILRELTSIESICNSNHEYSTNMQEMKTTHDMSLQLLRRNSFRQGAFRGVGTNGV